MLSEEERARGFVRPVRRSYWHTTCRAVTSWCGWWPPCGKMAPTVVVVDSLGELMPIMELSSNSPDDYTVAHRKVFTPMSSAGSCVIYIDHLPKSDEARAHGQTGTLAKRRAVNGVSLRVTSTEAFAPGRGGAASMAVVKDRPGGLRAHCPVTGKTQPAGRFVMTPFVVANPDPAKTPLAWHVTVPRSDGPTPDGTLMGDVAALDALDPEPKSKRDVQERMGWGSSRAQNALARWRERKRASAEETDPNEPLWSPDDDL